MRTFWWIPLALLLAAGCSGPEAERDVGGGGGEVGEVVDDAGRRPADVVAELDGPGVESGSGEEAAGEVVEPPPDTTVSPVDFALLSLAPTGDLTAVWGTDQRRYAVGLQGVILRYQGSHWSPMRSGTTVDLHCIFGLGEQEIYAGGDKGLVLRFDGEQWAPVVTGFEEELATVSLRGAWGTEGHLYMVGDEGIIIHLFEGKWKKEESLSGYSLAHVWGVSLQDIYVGAAGGTVLRRIGGAWNSEQVTGGNVTLHAMFGLSSKSLWTGGTAGKLIVHDSTGWVPKLTNDAYERTIRAIWAFTEADVWLIGESGVLVHSEGTKWNTYPIAGPYFKNHSFYGLWGWQGAEGPEAVAVGEKGAMVKLAGKEWSDQRSAPEVDLNDLAGESWQEVVAVGGDGLVLAYDGESWAGLDRVTGNSLSGVAPWQGGFLAVGAKGTVLSVDDGQVETVASAIDVDLRGICSRGETVAAVGSQGKLFVSEDGVAWQPVATGKFDALNDCAIDSTGTIHVVGDKGRILAVTGGVASAVAVATQANLYRIAVDDEDHLYAVGDNGLLLGQQGEGWEKLDETPGLFLYGVHVFDDEVMAVGWAGHIVRLDKATGAVTSQQAADPGVLLQVWGSDSNHRFIVGKKGRILQLAID